MPRVSVNYTGPISVGRPSELGAEGTLVMEPIEEDVYFRYSFVAYPVTDELLGATETIANCYISNIEVVTPGFPHANLSLITIKNSNSTVLDTASANGFMTGVFDRYFWRYYYRDESSANTAFFSDLAGFPQANSARFPEIPPASDKPIIYFGNPDTRRTCEVNWTITVNYSLSGNVSGGGIPSGNTTVDFVFSQTILNNWDVFRRRLIQLREDGRLGPYGSNTYLNADFQDKELDSVGNILEFGYLKIIQNIDLTSISSSNTVIGTPQVL